MNKRDQEPILTWYTNEFKNSKILIKINSLKGGHKVNSLILRVDFIGKRIKLKTDP